MVERPRARKRAHPAGASRILAAGLSATALFGLVAALTLSAPAPKAPETIQPVAAVTPPKQVVIVVHRPAAVATGPAPVSGGSSLESPEHLERVASPGRVVRGTAVGTGRVRSRSVPRPPR